MQDHPQVQRRNKFSLTLFRFMTRSEIYTDKERLTGERHHFTAFFNLHRNLHKGMKTQRSNKNRKLLYHLDNKFVETDKTKDLGLQVANDENSKVCFYSLYSPKSHISSDKDLYLYFRRKSERKIRVPCLHRLLKHLYFKNNQYVKMTYFGMTFCYSKILSCDCWPI